MILNPETQTCECIDCYTKDEKGQCTICTDACESMYYAGKQLCVSKVPQNPDNLNEVDFISTKPFEVKNEVYSDLNHGSTLEEIQASNDIAEINFNKITPYFKSDTGEVPRMNRAILPKHGKDYTNDWMPTPEDTTGTGVNSYRASLNLATNSMGLNHNQIDTQLTEFANGDIMDEYQPITELHRPHTKKPLEVWHTHYEKENSRVLNGRNEVPGPYATPIIEADSKLEFSKPIIPGSTIPEPSNIRNKVNVRVDTNNDLREHAQTYMGHAYVETSGDDMRRQMQSKTIRDRIRPSLKGPREAGKIVEPYIKYQSTRDTDTFNLKPKQDPIMNRYPVTNANDQAKPSNPLRDINNYQSLFNRDFTQMKQPYTNNSKGFIQSYERDNSLYESLKQNNSDELTYSTNNFDMRLDRNYYAEKNNNLKTGLPSVMAR